MKTLSYSESRARYAEVLNSVVDDREEVIITRSGHDPVVIVSLEDEVFAVHAPRLSAWLKHFASQRGGVPGWGLRSLQRLAQAASEQRSARVRMENLKLDRRMEKLLAFSGRGE